MIPAIGDVVILFDGTVRPPKDKLNICICPGTGRFLRINSRELWQPCVSIRRSDNPFLDHDSFVELRHLLFFPRRVVQDAVTSRRGILGCISARSATAIVVAATAAVTLTFEHKQLIKERLETIVDAAK